MADSLVQGLGGLGASAPAPVPVAQVGMRGSDGALRGYDINVGN